MNCSGTEEQLLDCDLTIVNSSADNEPCYTHAGVICEGIVYATLFSTRDGNLSAVCIYLDVISSYISLHRS